MNYATKNMNNFNSKLEEESNKSTKENSDSEYQYIEDHVLKNALIRDDSEEEDMRVKGTMSVRSKNINKEIQKSLQDLMLVNLFTMQDVTVSLLSRLLRREKIYGFKFVQSLFYQIYNINKHINNLHHGGMFLFIIAMKDGSHFTINVDPTKKNLNTVNTECNILNYIVHDCEFEKIYSEDKSMIKSKRIKKVRKLSMEPLCIFDIFQSKSSQEIEAIEKDFKKFVEVAMAMETHGIQHCLPTATIWNITAVKILNLDEGEGSEMATDGPLLDTFEGQNQEIESVVLASVQMVMSAQEMINQRSRNYHDLDDFKKDSKSKTKSNRRSRNKRVKSGKLERSMKSIDDLEFKGLNSMRVYPTMGVNRNKVSILQKNMDDSLTSYCNLQTANIDFMKSLGERLQFHKKSLFSKLEYAVNRLVRKRVPQIGDRNGIRRISKLKERTETNVSQVQNKIRIQKISKTFLDEGNMEGGGRGLKL